MINDKKPNMMKKRTPSRLECENIISRILITEVNNRTVNKTFKKPSDFMDFFESLYPPSAALTKQVQRALKSLDMAKDENGYYILNKSSSQANQEVYIRRLLSEANYSVELLEDAPIVFLKLDTGYIDFVLNKLSESITFRPFIVTMVATYNGLLIYTNDKDLLYNKLTGLTL